MDFAYKQAKTFASSSPVRAITRSWRATSASSSISTSVTSPSYISALARVSLNSRARSCFFSIIATSTPLYKSDSAIISAVLPPPSKSARRGTSFAIPSRSVTSRNARLLQITRSKSPSLRTSSCLGIIVFSSWSSSSTFLVIVPTIKSQSGSSSLPKACNETPTNGAWAGRRAPMMTTSSSAILERSIAPGYSISRRTESATS